MIERICSLCFMLLSVCGVMAQSAGIQIHKGNEAYRSSDYNASVEYYDEALEKDGDRTEARFNRANALLRKSAKMAEEAAKMQDQEMQQSAMEAAVEMNKKAASDFESLAKLAETDEDRNKALFNQGNAHLLSGDVDKSIEAYKGALRINPEDEAARYNLAYAMKLKQDQENQQQDQQDQDQEQEKDENQEQEQNQDQQDQNQENDQEQEPDQPDELSKEDAEKLLEAMMQREKELQEELNKRKRKPQVIKIEKDW